MYRNRDDERRRLNQEEGRRVRDELTRKIRESTIRGLRSWGRADELTHEIARRRVEARRDDVLEIMASKKGFLLSQLAGCRYFRRQEWQERLAGLELTSGAAAATLQAVCDEVDAARRLCANLGADPEAEPANPVPPVFRMPALPPMVSFTPVGPAGRILAERQRLDRQVREDYAQQARDLDLIASGLMALIGYVEEYQTLR